MENLLPLLNVSLAVAAIIFWAMAAKLALKLLHIDIKDISQRGDYRAAIVGTAANLLMLLTVLILLKFVAGKDLALLGFGFSLKHLLFSLVAIFLSFVTALIFIRVLHVKKVVMTSRTKEPVKLLMIIGASILLFLAAFQEEFIFRSYFAVNLVQYGFIAALLLSSAIFMLVHFFTNKVTIYQSAEWFLGGIALFTVYVVSGSIWVATLLHFTRNLANVTVLSLTQGLSFFSFDKPIAPAHKFVYTTTVLSILWILLAVLFYHQRF